MRICRTLSGDPVDLGRIYQLLGLIANCVGLSSEALSYYQLALTYFESHNCLREIAIVCSNLGDLYLRRAEFEAARAALRRSLLLVERIGDVPFSSVVLNNLGLLAARTGDLAVAETYYRRGIALSEQGNDPVSMCWLLASLVTTLQEQNNEVEARETVKRCLTIARIIRVIPCSGAALLAVGRLRLAQVTAWQIVEEQSGQVRDDTRRSLIKARKSIVHTLALDDIEAETKVEGQLVLAQTMMLQGELDEALSLVMSTMQDAQSYELRALMAYAQRLQGDILFRQRQYQQGAQEFERAIADFRNYGMRLECARTLQDYGIALLKNADSTVDGGLHAHECLQEARELFMRCRVAPEVPMIKHIDAPAFASSS
jgi:tetratricopeptide (TPR) repeat protein